MAQDSHKAANYLPREIWDQIAPGLSRMDLVRCSKVCRAWRQQLYKPEILLEGWGDGTILTMLAHDMAIPAAALRPFEGARCCTIRWTPEAKLCGSLFLRHADVRRIEVVDLSTGACTFEELDRDPKGSALTEEAYAWHTDDAVFFEGKEYKWDKENHHTDFGASMLSPICAIAGEGRRFVAVRWMYFHLSENTVQFGVGLLEIPSLRHTFRSIYCMRRGLSVVLHGEPVLLIESQDQLYVSGTTWGRKIEGTRWEGLRPVKNGHEVIVPCREETVRFDLDSLRWEKIDLKGAYWKGVDYTDGGLGSKFWHEEWLTCNSRVVVNERFLVAWHTRMPGHDDCPGYHAFTFDPEVAAPKMPREGLYRCKRRRPIVWNDLSGPREEVIEDGMINTYR